MLVINESLLEPNTEADITENFNRILSQLSEIETRLKALEEKK